MAKAEESTSTSRNSMSAAIPKRRAGERITGTYSPIRFFKAPGKKPVYHETEEGELTLEEVKIPVKIDPNGGYERANTTKEMFKRLLTFADAGEEVVELKRDLSVKLYCPMGLHKVGRLVSRLRYLSMTLGTTAKQQLSKAVKTTFL